MMKITDLLTQERTVCGVDASSKKRVLEKVSALLSQEQDAFPATVVFDSLIARERLGSTGLGKGVALPHGRLEGNEKTLGAFIKLQEGIDFDSSDKQPVDLLFAILVPEHSTEEHLQILATLARMFSDEPFCQSLRDCNSSEELYQLVAQWTSDDTP